MDNKSHLLEFDEKQFSIIKSWHNVSINQDYGYVKFFSNWISFNAICYGLFYEKGVKERVDIDNINKLPNIKSRLEVEESIYLDQGQIYQTDHNIKVKLKFPEPINFSIKERFIEHYIFNEFSKKFKNDLFFNSDDNEIIALKKALTKDNGRIYVIDMSRYTQHNIDNDIDEMSSKGVITLFEDSELSSIVNVLYQIRCNIFHGGKEPGDHHDDEIVEAANIILNKIVEFVIFIDPQERLDRIKNIIEFQSKIPKSEISYEGNYILIIPENDNRHGNLVVLKNGAIVVRTSYHKELSWLIFEIQKIYGHRTFFYDPLGETINISISNNKSIYEIFSDALNKSQELFNKMN